MAVPTGAMCGGMMSGMMGGFGGWLMMGTGLLFFALVVFSVAALAKYLFWSGRAPQP